MISDQSDSIGAHTAPEEQSRFETVLRDMIASPHFKGSRRQTDLLTYLVTETIAGRGEQISSYSVAFGVFGRDAGFDPKLNSITRVEMHRLRANLALWAKDVRNDCAFAIELEPRQYRPNLVSRQRASTQGESSPPGTLRVTRALVWRSVTALFLLVTLGLSGAYLLGAFKGTEGCRSQRPSVLLPQKIIGAPNDKASAELLTNLEVFLRSYPILDVHRLGQSPCDGAPQFSLRLEQQAGLDGRANIKAMLTDLNDSRIIWKHVLAPEADGDVTWQGVAMAQLAFMLGDSFGAMQQAASSDPWKDKDSEAEFRCILLAHQYFIESAPNYYKPARSCLISFYNKSNKADVPAMLASLEQERKLKGIGRVENDLNYYDLAIKAAEEIDPNNVSLLMVKLRAARIFPNQPISATTTLIDIMERAHPLEPSILNQIAVSQSWRLGQLDLAKENIRKSTLFSGATNSVKYPTYYWIVASGNFGELETHVENLLAGGWFVTDLFLVRFGDEQDRPDVTAKALAKLKAGECKGKRSCFIEWLDSNSLSDPLRKQLLIAINRHFSA